MSEYMCAVLFLMMVCVVGMNTPKRKPTPEVRLVPGLRVNLETGEQVTTWHDLSKQPKRNEYAFTYDPREKEKK